MQGPVSTTAERSPVKGSEIAVEEGCQLRLGECAYLGGLDFATDEQHQGRNAADAVLGRVA